ncbi:MAG TPA: SDR family oxidoreductase [Ferruginibacter sp.]|nr:SDR family oxidoreductase [Ferruginibacter sp.]HMP19627.1 SDR family oxidoreductase [Ferruginibacter sp.]
MNLFSLQNKNIVITGASSGIGRQCAAACNQLGAKVFLIGRNSIALEETKNMIPYPENAEIVIADLTQFEEVTKIVATNIHNRGLVHGIIHAAGISTTLPFRNVTTEKMNLFFNVNVVAALHLTQLLTKPASFTKDGGGIVFITSVMSQVGESAKVLYGMTKGALLAASKSLAIEYAPRKIRVNCIAPGVVDTPMSQKAYYSQNDTLKQKIQALHPLGLGKPNDVAAACCFLLSDAASWITGIQLTVDGGYTAR